MIKRREFIAGLRGAAAWPVLARAQGDRMRRIGAAAGVMVAAFMLAIGVDPAAADKCYAANGSPMQCPPDTPYAKPLPEPFVNFTPWGNNPCPSYEASFRQCVDRNGSVSQCSSEEKRVIDACGKT
jgi:hypothetical protein